MIVRTWDVCVNVRQMWAVVLGMMNHWTFLGFGMKYNRGFKCLSKINILSFETPPRVRSSLLSHPHFSASSNWLFSPLAPFMVWFGKLTHNPLVHEVT